MYYLVTLLIDALPNPLSRSPSQEQQQWQYIHLYRFLVRSTTPRSSKNEEMYQVYIKKAPPYLSLIHI